MESLSRPFHRRKLSNANSFSRKNAYDGVFSGHRPKFDGVPAVNVEEYHEIFGSGQAASSIPVLDLSTLEGSSDGLNLDVASMKPDYGKIFGGFRDHDIAISYEELIVRDKARSHSSTIQSSQDSSDLSQQSSNDLKQFNMSYNKISQRNKDGSDGTTHVTQLHVEPGFTCFIDESNSQPNKQNNVVEKQTSQNATESGIKDHEDEPVSNDKHFKIDNINPSVNSINGDIREKPTSENVVESKTRFDQDESVFNDKSLKTNNVLPSVNSINGDFHEKPTSENAAESKIRFNQDDSVFKDQSLKRNNIHPSVNSINGDFREKPTSENVVEPKIRSNQEELLSDDINLKTFQADSGSNSFKISSPPATSANIFNIDKDQKISTAAPTERFKSHIYEEFPASFFNEEGDDNDNSASANLRKAIKKAEESIRIARESVGRKKEGLRGFSNKSFKDSLKNKEKRKEKDVKMKERNYKNGVFPDFTDGEKLFGGKKVINEIDEKFLESDKEIPIMSPVELTESVEIKTFEIENHEKKLKNIDKNDNLTDSKENVDHKLVEESSNLTVYENEKKISQEFDQNDHEKRFSVTFGFLETKKQETIEQEQDEKLVSETVEDEKLVRESFEDEKLVRESVEDEKLVSESVEDEKLVTESVEDEKLVIETVEDEKLETGENFYDVSEVETVENNSQTYDYNLKTNEENHESEEKLDKFQEPIFSENSSSDYDDAEDNIKVDQKVSNAEPESESESSQPIDDVSSSDSAHELQVEDKEVVENVSADQTASEEDDDVSNCSSADVDFEQNCMEIEVKQLKESIKQEETPAGPPQEPEDACRESEPVKEEETKRIKETSPEEKEQERIKLAVERAIREARERAFIEARERAKSVAKAKQRVITDTQEKVANDKISLKLKLKAERAAVERATAEARQRALQKAVSQKNIISEPRVQVNEIKETCSASHPTAESALRTKAKMEKHNRIMERAAKALAEKEQRDMLVMKEQAERNRLAENLDAEIKRWSMGKEGNLRALLSTLQYILGSESGWQAVSLTEIITSNAVKKAYRKATLCVHPDKLQQRGATIHQKYICEKVFDLLKAAWNRFNSEER